MNKMKTLNEITFIKGKRIYLRPLCRDDFTPDYLNWLNDPVINSFSQRRSFPYSWDKIDSYNKFYSEHPEKGFVLAIIEKQDENHIGNISLVNIQLVNRCAEIAILIGNKQYWNKGYSNEAIYHLTKHAFECINLHKIFAGSFNPAFVKSVAKIGWTKEGEFRERIWSDNQYHNQIWMGILKSEFKIIPELEADKKG